jgi:hypothetical integral membrane protein (TIGR02206 family)
MPPGSSSLFLSADHLAVVALTLVGTVVACLLARRDPKAAWVPWFLRALAAVQIVNAVATQVWLVRAGKWTAASSLPLQLCDAAIVASVVASLRPSPLAFELAYFWGLGAALQGLITPAIVERFPEPVYLQFFVVHVGLPMTAAFLAFGLGMTPRQHSVFRLMLWTNAFAVIAGIACWLTGGNYMFLRTPPPTGSVLDHLGPWPWYLLAAEVIAAAVFAALALPFVFRRRRAGAPA